MSTSICLISTVSPYDGIKATEALNVIYVSASFDIKTSLILMGDGVYQAISNQAATQSNKKPFINRIKALPLYGVEQVYIDQQSLEERNIKPESLLHTSIIIQNDQLKSLIDQHHTVLTF